MLSILSAVATLAISVGALKNGVGKLPKMGYDSKAPLASDT